ncbi:hypothetical protein EDB85DRAFT_1889900 [Lactarius pseudohatsudake]|nr:hypothetical protein EDB85DRAFT_1889900 [Lactarius pseudohatsudake]
MCKPWNGRKTTWQARVPVGSLTTGDYGYIPGGSTDFANFMRLGNILNDFEDGKAMEVVGETHGTSSCGPADWACSRPHIMVQGIDDTFGKTHVQIDRIHRQNPCGPI